MLVIGLTGPSGAGKGEVASVFRSYGIPVIDADEVYHALLTPPSPCLDALCARFGTEILKNDGTLDRPCLGSIVFSDPAALADLNAISHRYVMEDIQQWLDSLRKSDTAVAVIDAPQLFEAGADKLCASIVAVLADRETRATRIMARDGIDRESAMRRINAQKSDAFFREKSDFVIENDASVDSIAPLVRDVLYRLGVSAP